MLAPQFFLGFPGLLLLGASAQATRLEVTQSLNIRGPGGVSALLALPDGGTLACLGSRWVKLDAQGKVLQAAALPLADTCRDLALSPHGKTLLVTGNTVTLWNTADARLFQSWPDAQGGFLSNTDVLLRSGSKLERLNIIAGVRETLNTPAMNSLFVAPDGKRAVISDGQRVQLVSLPDFTVLSASRCNAECTVQNAHFSADGRTAIALAGRTLLGLREGVPVSTIMRDTDAATGLPQPDNTVLTFSAAGVESRDLQTGRSERKLLEGVQPGPATQQGKRVLAVNATGELLDTSLDFKTVRRTPMPAAVSAGGMDASGNIYTLNRNKGVLMLGQKPVSGTYWALETMNKTTWALRSDSDGGIQVGTLSGEKFTPIPGSPRTATHLSVNHWGNHAAVWDDETLWIISQAKNKVVATVKLTGKVNSITVSPDATRAYVFPGEAGNGEPYVLTLANGKSAPLPAPLQPAGGWLNTMQISGKGVFALLGSRSDLFLRYPDGKLDSGSVVSKGMQQRFSPDGKWLAYSTLSDEGPRITLLNVETNRIETSSAPLASLPTFLTWSADSKKLAVGASLLNELSSVTMFEVK